MSTPLSETLSAIAVFGCLYLLWLLWGSLARAVGVSRMALLGAVALFGWLLG